MSSQALLYLVLGVAVLGLLVYRQLRARPAQGNQRIVLILVGVGLIEAVHGMQRLHAGSAAIVSLAGDAGP